MNLLYKIKRILANKKIQDWHTDWSVPSKKTVRKVANGKSRIYTPELEAFLDKACIRRYYDGNMVCVDVYWHIKPSRKEGHIYTIHYRRDWNKVTHTISRVEKYELPRAIYDAFKEYQRQSLRPSN